VAGGLGLLALALAVACGATSSRNATRPTAPSGTARVPGTPALVSALLLTYDCSSAGTGRVTVEIDRFSGPQPSGGIVLDWDVTNNFYLVDPASVAELAKRLAAADVPGLGRASPPNSLGSGCVLTYNGQRVDLPYNGIPTQNTAAAMAVKPLRPALQLLQQIEDRTVFSGAAGTPTITLSVTATMPATGTAPISASASPAAIATPSTTAKQPRIVTQADNGTTLSLRVGEQIVLRLGPPYTQAPLFNDPAVLRAIGDTRNRVYKAVQPGETTLSIPPDPPACTTAHPPCVGLFPSSPAFYLAIVVQP